MKIRRRHSVVGIGCAWLALAGAIPAAAQEIIELPAEDRTLELEFEELYRLGTFAGEEWEQFGDVQSVAFDAAGNLLVFDQHDQAQKIYVVDPEGRLVREIGGWGEGPGERGSGRVRGRGRHGGHARWAGGGGGSRPPGLSPVRRRWRIRANGAQARVSFRVEDGAYKGTARGRRDHQRTGSGEGLSP